MKAPMKTIRIPLSLGALIAAVALAGCETTGAPSPSAQASAPVEAPMTHQRAASECWMATEKGHGDMNLDKRADIVTKCIDDKMSGKKTAAIAPERSKAEAKPKSDAKPKPKAAAKPDAKPDAKPKADDAPEQKSDDSGEPKPKT
jgi:hypothetical protein